VPPTASMLGDVSWFGLLGAVWIGGIVFGLARLLHGIGKTRRLIAASQPVTDAQVLAIVEQSRRRLGLPRACALSLSPAVSRPVVGGVLFPRILVPPALLRSESRDDLRVALLHECGHIRRHDMAFEVLQQLVGAAYWFHPLVHVMNRALRRLREELCD